MLLHYGYDKINYTRYISKSMIHVYLSKLHKKVDIDDLYSQIKQYLHSGDSSLFQMYVDTHKIRKKTMKLLLQIYEDVYPVEKLHHTTLLKSIVYHTDWFVWFRVLFVSNRRWWLYLWHTGVPWVKHILRVHPTVCPWRTWHVLHPSYQTRHVSGIWVVTGNGSTTGIGSWLLHVP